MPGPPKTPTNKLKLRGSWRGKTRRGEPQPPAGIPDAPAWLSAEAREAYTEVAAQLHGLGMMTMIDRNALARYADLWVSYCLSRDVNEQIKLSAELGKLERQFGLTPSARASLASGPKPAAADDGRRAKFLKRVS